MFPNVKIDVNTYQNLKHIYIERGNTLLITTAENSEETISNLEMKTNDTKLQEQTTQQGKKKQ